MPKPTKTQTLRKGVLYLRCARIAWLKTFNPQKLFYLKKAINEKKIPKHQFNLARIIKGDWIAHVNDNLDLAVPGVKSSWDIFYAFEVASDAVLKEILTDLKQGGELQDWLLEIEKTEILKREKQRIFRIAKEIS